jgi:hypothetical protein
LAVATFGVPLMLRLVVTLAALATLLASPLAAAQKDPGAPKPDTYLCPNAVGAKAVDCFLDAVAHLYTMCRQVKSIEIIEFGYEKSDEGVNGAKSEYCVDKHKLSMTRPYQAALRVSPSAFFGCDLAASAVLASFCQGRPSEYNVKPLFFVSLQSRNTYPYPDSVLVFTAVT